MDYRGGSRYHINVIARAVLRSLVALFPGEAFQPPRTPEGAGYYTHPTIVGFNFDLGLPCLGIITRQALSLYGIL